MDNRYIIITGGGFLNKGAQAMTFVTVNELKKKYPDKKILVMSSDNNKKDNNALNQYHFEVIPDKLPIRLMLMGGCFKFLALLRYRNKTLKRDFKNIKKIFLNTDCIIDISGFSLSSSWGFLRSLYFILKIMIARKYHIDMYIMPQSFGPFHYKNKIEQLVVDYFIKKYMRYPKKVYAREEEGYRYLCNDYNLRNVGLSYDIVLLNDEIQLQNIYTDIPEFAKFVIDDRENNVAIIPNTRTLNQIDEDSMIDFYQRIIRFLLEKDRTVYLIAHSAKDRELVIKLKGECAQNAKLILIEEDPSCFEFTQNIKHFDFCIASRYHSIVHAFKCGVPCIVLGWAVKYQELLKCFEQERYAFDVRDNLNSEVVIAAVNKMIVKHEWESELINKRLKEIRAESDDVFKFI